MLCAMFHVQQKSPPVHFRTRGDCYLMGLVLLLAGLQAGADELNDADNQFYGTAAPAFAACYHFQLLIIHFILLSHFDYLHFVSMFIH